MVRNYKRKTKKGSYGAEGLQRALDSVKNGMSLRKAENSFGVSRKTLRRHLQGKVRQVGSNKLGNHVNTFSIKIEQDLVKHIQMMERALLARNETSEPTNTNEEAGNAVDDKASVNVMETDRIATGDSNESDENQLDKTADHPGLSEALQIISELSPIPRIKNVRSRKRKTEAATVITSSPYKAMLIEANAKKTKQNKQVVVENNNEENDEDEIDVIADKSKRTKSGDDKETRKRKQYARTKSKRTIKSNASNANVIRKGSKERRCVGSVTNSDDTPCCMCGKRFNEPPIDDWQQCPECLNWYHDGCGPDDTAVCFHCQ